ncbi:hypothetical protein EYF80_064296 [Liparis tanakae]|uniref:Uncharacterized protein n=1 Tax=Liparis tanakae TaxID=230148 RepID=A0A4Z2EBC3_9TELE|nr:hypothetical protein EYF80_064296 [Liparis tanakae]
MWKTEPMRRKKRRSTARSSGIRSNCIISHRRVWMSGQEACSWRSEYILNSIRRLQARLLRAVLCSLLELKSLAKVCDSRRQSSSLKRCAEVMCLYMPCSEPASPPSASDSSRAPL